MTTTAATIQPTDIYADDDYGQPMTALDYLSDRCWLLAEYERELAPTQARIAALRAEISTLAAQLGRTIVPQFGTVEITSAAKVASYDRAGVDALVQTLLAAGQLDLAQQLSALRRETARAGGLRISREKPTASDA